MTTQVSTISYHHLRATQAQPSTACQARLHYTTSFPKSWGAHAARGAPGCAPPPSSAPTTLHSACPMAWLPSSVAYSLTQLNLPTQSWVLLAAEVAAEVVLLLLCAGVQGC
mmetsp:Transcript_31133/g.79390  ORF Transcript_31133/g.79390 Transcript_31133/m.79390 type:complete len:111 (+) Transcript_31133:2180-2512(+)